ncbi:hypothetical protein TTHERM_00509130 (macronuclear) [Tetrahymena thermophila SB210]|uniref:Transmembrane protein n=1 Tax=Tetrahymena thermophila (strain SB210) TaxID=312017 RepID=I7M156_TETTS|nr:hypothetical protein TTHERM_00509130 [Tetrahymena thermophila SB210]EAR94972.3 hypothetical protein TTHERM_00509130 [Tetrahymena thermophila SB210]|eukprot:XP_001015217.3 hypothetical protein TTHERM_00509130 [Tetrahymena thermophila SB210]
MSFNLPDLPFDCKQALIGTWNSPDDGYALTICSSDCYHKTNSSIISFLMDTRPNKSGDMLLNYQIGSQINYSIFQVDLLYLTEGDVNLNVNVNSKLQFSFTTLKYSFYVNNYRDLYCQATEIVQKASLSFYRSDASFMDNNLNIHFEKMTNYKPNYYRFGIKAIQISMICSITCQACLDESNCDVCKYSFKKITLPSGLQVCEQITSCSQNCFLCAVSQTENICTQCFPGYSLLNNQCISLDKLNICKSQPNTYYADPNQCLKYAQNAVKYQNGSYQRTNMETYYSYKCPNNQVVILYPESYYSLYWCGCYTKNCASCPYGICITCSEGYNIKNNECIPTCKANQYLDAVSNKCIDCGTNCQLCNSTICQQCTDSTFQVDQRNPQNCISINSCVVSNCQTCKSQNPFSCQVCSPNNYLNSDQRQCFPCSVPNCSQCFSENYQQCQQCSQNYSLSSDKQQCMQCQILNCLKCDPQNNLICQVCQANTYLSLDQSQCLPCSVPNCLQCSQNYQQCQQCSQNYSLSSDKKQCMQCQILNCLTCDQKNNLICQVCQTKAYLNSDQTQCLPCSVQNCQECQSTNNQLCQKCNSGYQVSSDSKSCYLIPEIPQQVRNYFHLEQTLTTNGYSVNINFDNPLVQSTLNNLDYFNIFSIQITGIDSNKYTLQFSLTSNKLINLLIAPACNIKNSYLNVTITSAQFVHENSMKNTSQELQLSIFVLISQSNIDASQKLTQYGSIFVTSSLLSIIPAIFFGNIYIICNTLDITGFLYYLMFLDIRYPLNIMNFYQLFKNFNFPFIPNFFLYIIDPNYVQQSPPQFMAQETDNYYLKNFGQYFTIYLAGFMLYLLAKIFARSPIKYLNLYCQRAIKETWEFSAMIDLCWSFYIYLVVAVLIQFNTYNFDDVYSCFLNYMLHSISTITVLGIPFLFFVIIYKQKNKINDQNFIQKYSSLISGLKITLDQVQSQNQRNSQNNNNTNSEEKKLNDFVTSQSTKLRINDLQNNRIRRKKIQTTNSIVSSETKNSPAHLTTSFCKIEENQLSYRKKLVFLLSRYYNVLLYFRKILFCIVISYFYNEPYHQIALISILNLLLAVFIIIITPFQSNYYNYQFILQELSLITIQVLASLLINDDQDVSEDYRMKIGWIIIGISSFWIIYYTLLIFKDKIKEIKCQNDSQVLIKNYEKSQSTASSNKIPLTQRSSNDYSQQINKKIQENQQYILNPMQIQINNNSTMKTMKGENLIQNYV